MNVRAIRLLALLTGTAVAGVIAACSGGSDGDPVGGYDLRVSGQLVDWRSGAAISEVAQIRTVGIAPERTAESEDDGTFVVRDIPTFGYVILDITVPGYAHTLSPTILVEDEDVEDLVIEVLSDADATAFLGGFAITTTAGSGHVLGRVLSTAGVGVPGVAAIQLLPVSLSPDGPYFYDANDQPDAAGIATGPTGTFSFFNSGLGSATIQGSAPGNVLPPVASVIRDNAWSLVVLGGVQPEPGTTATPFPTATPGPQAFQADILPIFANKGCTANGCHNKVGGTAAAGGLDLQNPQPGQTYDAIVTDDGGTRINLADIDTSLLLKKPLFDDPPDHGGGTIFPTDQDPDYQKIRRWLFDGAPEN